MKSRRQIPIFLLAGLLSLLPLASAMASNNDGEIAPVYDAHSAFEALKSFEGEWKSTPVGGDSTRASTVVYKVTANGHSVIKTYGPGSKYEMFSVYHMDGEELKMTHYCAIGNQPKMKFKASDKAGEMFFEFDGGTNFDPNKDAHAHEGLTRVTGSDTQESMSVGYSDGQPQEPRRSTLVRAN